jgi:hypothetical protein
MDKDGYHGYDMSKLTIPAAEAEKFTFTKPQENNIVFFNTMGGTHTEVLRITKDGITANPDVPTDEAADAVIRALDGYIKGLVQKEYERGFEDGKTRP